MRLVRDNLRTPFTGGAEAHNGGTDWDGARALDWEVSRILRFMQRVALGRFSALSVDFVSGVWGLRSDVI